MNADCSHLESDLGGADANPIIPMNALVVSDQKNWNLQYKYVFGTMTVKKMATHDIPTHLSNKKDTQRHIYK